MGGSLTWRARFENLLTARELGEHGFVQAQALKREHLPGSLFKYCREENADRDLEILRSGQVWLTDPQQFNDPLDCIASFDVDGLFASIENSVPDPARSRSQIFRMIQGEIPPSVGEGGRDALVGGMKGVFGIPCSFASQLATQRLRTGLGVTCFAESGLSAPMWAHYASYHHGFCIEWRIDDWLAAPDHLEKLFPVLYDENPFEMPSLALNPHFERAYALLALRKAADWSYEREWRYVSRFSPEVSDRFCTLPRPKAVHMGHLIAHELRSTLVQVCREVRVSINQIRCASDRGSLVSEGVP